MGVSALSVVKKKKHNPGLSLRVALGAASLRRLTPLHQGSGGVNDASANLPLASDVR